MSEVYSENSDGSEKKVFRNSGHVTGGVGRQEVDGLRKKSGDTLLPGPAAPGNLRAVAGDGMVQLRWDESSDSKIAGYLVWQEGVPGWKRVATVRGNESYRPHTWGYKVTGLENGKTYTVPGARHVRRPECPSQRPGRVRLQGGVGDAQGRTGQPQPGAGLAGELTTSRGTSTRAGTLTSTGPRRAWSSPGRASPTRTATR